MTKMLTASTPTALSYVLAKRDSLGMEQLAKVIVILALLLRFIFLECLSFN